MKLIDADSLREKLQQKVVEADRKRMAYSHNGDLGAMWAWMQSEATWKEALLILDHEKEVDP